MKKYTLAMIEVSLWWGQHPTQVKKADNLIRYVLLLVAGAVLDSNSNVQVQSNQPAHCCHCLKWMHGMGLDGLARTVLIVKATILYASVSKSYKTH